MEIFIHFYDLMSLDLLVVVKESSNLGFIPGAFNAMFIALISNKLHPQYFVKFFPISLCNPVYKVISKLIASRINEFLYNIFLLNSLVFSRVDIYNMPSTSPRSSFI